MRGVTPDATAAHFIETAARFGPIRIIANRPDKGDRAEYEHKLGEARESHHLAPNEPVLFLEVRPGDASEFSEVLVVEGAEVEGHRILRCQSPAIPNAIAALLLYLRDTTRTIPHAYFGWTEGNPIAYLLKFLVFGEGDTAPVTREVLRQTEDDPELRPRIHVGRRWGLVGNVGSVGQTNSTPVPRLAKTSVQPLHSGATACGAV